MEDSEAPLSLAPLDPPHVLPYSIHSFSSHTNNYHPSNILEDTPSDQGSRWTGPTGASSDAAGVAVGDDNRADGRGLREVPWLTLELEKPSLVVAIGFGKYLKLHPCNLASFAVYGGMSPNPRHMELLFHGGLKNDSIKERFELSIGEKEGKGKGEVLLPVRYIRIDAHAAHSQNYNVSIWHVWLEGHADEPLMARVLSTYEAYRSLTTSHLILAYLRRSFLLPAFHSLLSSLPLPSQSLEHPLLTSLHSSLVLRGSFSGPESAESCLCRAVDEGLFREWGTGKGKTMGRWERMCGGPCPRGGHQMVRVGRKVLLHGGWDGERDWADLWEWEMGGGGWRCLSERGEGGPRGRSCHQLAVDEGDGWVYLLGGMEESLEKGVGPIEIPGSGSNGVANGGGTNGAGEEEVRRRLKSSASDFWRYKAVGPGKGSWELLSEDTGAEGGPKLIYDHQMVVDSEGQRLFVFGGKLSQAPASDSIEGRYSGMFSYDIPSRKWTYLFGDPTPGDPFRAERLLSRIGHSMLFDPTLRTLFIFAGQREDKYLADLWSIKLSSPSCPSPSPAPWRSGTLLPSSSEPTLLQTTLLSADYSTDGPAPGFTQRATIDVASGEWTVLTGMVKDEKSQDEVPAAEVWTHARGGGWRKVECRGEVPEGRYGGQVVYDPLFKDHYMFGGNPQDPEDLTRRMGDFWRLRIVKPSPEEALRQAKFLVRKQKFTEMCQTQPTVTALTYLQTTLAEVVDHTDEAEASAFRSCMASLLAAPSSQNYEDQMDDSDPLDVEGGDEPMIASMSSGDFSAMAESQRLAQSVSSVLDPELYRQRHQLFEQLLDFVPDEERQPKEDLRNLVRRNEGRSRSRYD